MNDTFRIFGHLDFEKSMKNLASHEAGEEKEILIEGVMLNMVKDVSGERPIVPKMDWTYFDENGIVKYEHDPIEAVFQKGTMIQRSVPNPANNIGVPLSHHTINDGKSEFIKATLFPSMEYTKDVVKLMKALAQHNELHPSHKREIGFSIEGSYLKKSTNGDYIGKVLNVVLTPQPQDSTTYSRLAGEHNSNLAKSLAAGGATDPASTTGGGALRQQDLEGSTKNQTSSKGAGTMEQNFKNKDEAYTFFKKSGCTEKEAKEKTDEYFAKKKTAKKTAQEEVEKSVVKAADFFTKAITGLTAFQKTLPQLSEEIEQGDISLKKSIRTKAADPDGLDGVQFLMDQAGNTMRIATMVHAGNTEIAKSVQSIAEGLGEFLSIQKSMTATIQALEEEVSELQETDRVRFNQMRKSTASLNLHPAQTTALAAGAEDPEREELRKSIPLLRVEDYLANQGVKYHGVDNAKANMYFKAQNAFQTQQWRGLDSAMAAEVEAQFKK